ncbi:hypothetical protein SCH4B_1484 [Ruegeria sp. TrichCH4B]|nr:hypothetical protein SCH4B_1484 [Ruegeria sp. TrichCH4B]
MIELFKLQGDYSVNQKLYNRVLFQYKITVSDFAGHVPSVKS